MGDVKLSSPQEFRDGKVRFRFCLFLFGIELVFVLFVFVRQILNYMVHKNVPDVIPLNSLDSETPQVRVLGKPFCGD